MKTELAPHVDFGIFGPHAIHIQQKVKLTGMMLNTSGGLFRSEMAGPMTFEQWESCYRVSRTAIVMLRVARPSARDSYLDHVKQYHMRYSHECWAVLYQTDTRARRELAERIRRRGRIKYDEVAAATPETQRVAYTYDPQIPWDFVFRKLPKKFAFWKRELEDPARMLLTKITKNQGVVTQEAPVVSQPEQHVSDAALQEGYCNTSACPKDLAHQCRRCVDPGRGASQCTRKGKGGGRGSKGRGKGKRNQW